MLTLISVRRAGAVVAAAGLATALIATSGVAQAAPAATGGHWLSGQLTDGLVHNDQYDFDDYGLSIDTAFALRAVGGHWAGVKAIRNAVKTDVGNYIGVCGGKCPGETAKALVLAQSTGGNPRSFGGVDLVKRLNGLVTKSGRNKGRVANKSPFPDYASTISQILAVHALTTAKSGQAANTRRFLLKQQCNQGYFRLLFSAKKAKNQSCRKKDAADPDTTSYAVIQLWKTSKGHPKLRGSLKDAVAWLADQQRKNGSFIGGTSTATPNANSTGLAGWALGLTGHCSAAKAAASWVSGLQVGKQKAGSALAGQRGAIAYDKAALRAGKKHGITTTTQDQWRRATAQAAPVLTFRHGC
jgi:hypothetical protein